MDLVEGLLEGAVEVMEHLTEPLPLEQITFLCPDPQCKTEARGMFILIDMQYIMKCQMCA